MSGNPVHGQQALIGWFGGIGAVDAGWPVGLVMQMLWSGLSAPSPWDAHRLESKSLDFMGRSADAAEGVASFLEKRPPNFPLQVSKDLPDIGAGDWPERPEDVG